MALQVEVARIFDENEVIEMHSLCDDKTVSSSEVLDYFIEENEKPSVILHFLDGMTDDDLDNTLRNSNCVTRIFQLDFISKCGFDERRYFMVLSRRYGDFQANYLSWQVMQSDLDCCTRNMFRPNLSIRKRGQQHPHTGIYGRVAVDFDKMFLSKNIGVCEISNILNSMTNNDFSSFCVCLSNSLFVERILQLDTFTIISSEKKWILLNKLCESISRRSHSNSDDITTCRGLNDCLRRFVKQVLGSQIDTDIKCEVFNRLFAMCRFPEMHKVSGDIKSKILTVDSYPELELSLVLNGLEDNWLTYVICMLSYKRIDLVNGFCKIHGDLLERYFDITDMIRELWSGGTGLNGCSDNII